MSEERMTWLKHPMVNMIVGFILTGVLGTTITQHYLDLREQEKLRTQGTLDRKQAIQQFAKLSEARIVHAELMLKVLRSHSSDKEIKASRQEYRKAFVAWSVERPGMLLLFRELLSSENYQLVKTQITQSLEGKIFDPIRLCLTRSLEHGDDRAAVNKTLKECRIDELLELSGTCSLAMATAVSDLAGAHSEWILADDSEEIKKRAFHSINQQCP